MSTQLKQVTVNMTGPLQNISMFCITIEHKAFAAVFLNILQKYYQLPILGILKCLDTSIKKNNTNL